MAIIVNGDQDKTVSNQDGMPIISLNKTNWLQLRYSDDIMEQIDNIYLQTYPYNLKPLSHTY